jgi:hypothetical protein
MEYRERSRFARGRAKVSIVRVPSLLALIALLSACAPSIAPLPSAAPTAVDRPQTVNPPTAMCASRTRSLWLPCEGSR